MGNICRSPTAEGVFRKLAGEAGIEEQLHIDSAGTHDYHVGRAPDDRAQHAASGRGYDLSKLRARFIAPSDFEKFDHVLVMDRKNMREMEKVQQYCRAPKAKLQFLLDYHPVNKGGEVPDPYGGEDKDFEQVLDLVEAACENLLKTLLQEKGLTNCAC